MASLRKRILLELFITPATVVPALIGGSLLLLSGILGGYSAFLGFVGLLLSFGSFLTNVTLNLESISKRAMKIWHEEEMRRRENELDKLDGRLQRTDGDADENALRNLRVLYKSFNSDVAAGNVGEHVPPQMLTTIEEIFTTCILKLQRTADIYKTSKSMAGQLRQQMIKQREQVISEVEASVLELANVINEVRALRFKTEGGELKRLQQRLTSQLEVAKMTEAGISSMDNDLERFKEYE